MATLREIMTESVFTVGPDATVADVAREMVEGRFGSAVILENGWIAGIFTERDVVRAAASGQDLSGEPVRQWMTKDPMAVPADTEVGEAMQLMASNGFRHLPVAEGRDLLGIVSLRDVLATRIARAPR